MKNLNLIHLGFVVVVSFGAVLAKADVPEFDGTPSTSSQGSSASAVGVYCPECMKNMAQPGLFADTVPRTSGAVEGNKGKDGKSQR